MQKFILIILILGLGFFIYLLQTNQITQEDFNINALKGDAEFIVKKTPSDSPTKSSDLYIRIKNKEYKISSFYGDDFKTLLKVEYASEKYKIPEDAKDAIVITSIGNKYIYYVQNKDGKNYEIYKGEYPTDNISKLGYFQIKVIEESQISNKVEVKY